MSGLLDDILAEAGELDAIAFRLCGEKRALVERAASVLRGAPEVVVVGIGSSWNAGLAVSTRLRRCGVPAFPADASELLHFGSLRPGAAVLVLSRSGRSVEVVRLLERCAAVDAPILAVTNTPDSPLGRLAAVTLDLEARFDRLVSVTMYSGLAVAGGLLAEAAGGAGLEDLGRALRESLKEAGALVPEWGRRLEGSPWLDPAATPYFLARGESVASAQEARLLWEEVAKRPAAALSTGAFRHGSQEIVRPGSRVALWLDAERLRAEDLTLARELRGAGALVALVGRDLPDDAADLALPVPATPPGWAFAVDIVPMQLAAEALARRAGEDPDAFRYCPYVVSAEGGLTGGTCA